MSESWVLDASALLALLNKEAGYGQVKEAIDQGSVMGAVNLSEVISKLSDYQIPSEAIQEMLENLGIVIVEFDRSLAYDAGLLRLRTIKTGLSFGDRACLAVAEKLQAPCLTADKIWANLKLSIEVKLIR